MHCLLVAGGVLANPAALLAKITPADYNCIIAVDHGYDHCAALGLVPDVLMGDLDSVENAQPSGALQTIPFAPEKDDTDLRLAAQHALSLGASGIDIICATGGRLDHFMGNLSLLEFLQEQAPTLPVRIVDESNIIRLLVPMADGRAQHYPRRSKYISLIPVSTEICFTGKGLKYPAQHLTVRRSNMISISNEAQGDAYAITLHHGKALLIEAD